MRNLILLLRPRTLPLAVAVIGVGNALAFEQGSWRTDIFVLSLLTALALQILSNVANDYGDGICGTDHKRAEGSPKRLTAAGVVSARFVRNCMMAWALLCLCSGALLLAAAVRTVAQLLLFICLGWLSIAAALAYTVGRRPYGYCGLGEAAVFVFFGLVGVLGSFALQHSAWHWPAVLPAMAMGLLCAAVLNVNNMRDIDSDRLAGKYTLAVRLGLKYARRMHIGLLAGAGVLLLLFNSMTAWQGALWLVLLPMMCRHGQRVVKASESQQLAAELPVAVRLCGAVALLLSLGLVWSAV